jgi:Uma2 family endonuclease
MGMPAQQTAWTAEEVLALPDDGNRYEVLDGELFVSPAPSFSHQFVVQAFVIQLMPYVDQLQLGWVLAAPADITFSPRRLVQPDIFVVPDTGLGRPREWKDVRRLSLVIEVLSPSTAHADRWRKRTIYQSERIPDYWIVDPDARVVERWNPDDERPAIVAELLTWHPRSGAPPLEISLPVLFDSALD